MVICFFFVNLIMQFKTHIRKLFGVEGGGGYQTVNSFKEKKNKLLQFFSPF